ncbi:nitroreductase family deazaflavin-dependent oxidoreductase [Nocardioides sp.]|uniref:nitroreductase family deazaflavin-dependent oxidoreductase n=1 Tax=Nocardioides sp. TaxID=35761 RepID=UPI00356193DE
MTSSGSYAPSPADWVREQVATYEASGGTEGNTLRGVPIVVITSRGAKSGKLRKNPVMRVEHNGAYAAIASSGGDPQHPAWFHNFVADPRVHLQDGPHPEPYVARRVEGEERALWWERAVAVWPAYDDYAAKTDRDIPVFVLERA